MSPSATTITNGSATAPPNSKPNRANNRPTALEALQLRIQRLEDIQEITQLMSRRAYYHSAGRHDLEVSELWCSDSPTAPSLLSPPSPPSAPGAHKNPYHPRAHAADVVFEPEDVGAFTSLPSLKKAYVDGNPFPPGTKGLMVEHTLTTPLIEIASDGVTAKGVWISPGHETFPLDGEGEDPKAHWSWGRYAVDFVKEAAAADGASKTAHGGEGPGRGGACKWKIWHLHVQTTFRTPYGVDWVAAALEKPAWLPKDGETTEEQGAVDRGVSFNEPYHPDCAPKLQPVPPRPYDSWGQEGRCWSATERVDFEG
ncbi:hypothetical protein MKZ38_004869 [Zalerion maritima]|uniref:Uncharacterized protein n=1 Tax=Zalerion maritima TaxID=339359 RepID=A0AAD5RL47_9PEZI|nr:hypothetical protein MKZ38_004869 [Zalerion maritima]